MTVIADEKMRVVIPGANPGDKFELSSPSPEQVLLTRLEAGQPAFSTGQLVRDPKTGLLVWTGDVGEDDADAVIRNRANDE